MAKRTSLRTSKQLSELVQAAVKQTKGNETWEEYGQMVGVKGGTLSALARGTRPNYVRLATIQKFAESVGVPLEAFQAASKGKVAFDRYMNAHRSVFKAVFGREYGTAAPEEPHQLQIPAENANPSIVITNDSFQHPVSGAWHSLDVGDILYQHKRVHESFLIVRFYDGDRVKLDKAGRESVWPSKKWPDNLIERNYIEVYRAEQQEPAGEAFVKASPVRKPVGAAREDGKHLYQALMPWPSSILSVLETIKEFARVQAFTEDGAVLLFESTGEWELRGTAEQMVEQLAEEVGEPLEIRRPTLVE